jgi:hypothetical protein
MELRILAVSFLISSTVSVVAGERLTMRVSPARSFAPSNVTVRVHVEPDADNRALEVVAESGEYYRSSRIGLEGAEAPRMLSIEMRNLPGGAYEVRCALTDSVGRQRAAVRSHVIVLGSADGE